MKPAIIYCRVSTSKQAQDGLSLESQEQSCRDKCAANDWRVKGVFVERGVSGRTQRKRKELSKAIAAVCENKGVLVFYSLSRLARSVQDALAISEKIEACGGAMASATDQIDTTTPMGRAFYTIMATIARLESDIIGERIKASNAYTVKKLGYRTQGRQPLGWKIENGVRVPCPVEQELLAKVLATYEANRGNLNRTCIALEAASVPTPMKLRHGRDTRWQRTVVRSIVRANLA